MHFFLVTLNLVLFPEFQSNKATARKIAKPQARNKLFKKLKPNQFSVDCTNRKLILILELQ